MRTEKHSPAEPGIKQSRVDETDRYASSFPSLWISFSLSSCSLLPGSIFVSIYHPSPHLQLYYNDSEQEY